MKVRLDVQVSCPGDWTPTQVRDEIYYAIARIVKPQNIDRLQVVEQLHEAKTHVDGPQESP